MTHTGPAFSVFALLGLPEFRPGDDLAGLLGDALAPVIEDGDIIAVTSKIVSKAEGRLYPAEDREDAITAETVRVVATRAHADGSGITRIVENRQGLVMAAAGVDASNVDAGHVLLLPEEPDRSARHIAEVLRVRFHVRVGVILTDTMGRPWREGQTDAAIGAAGVVVLNDLAGTVDAHGHPLAVTAPAIADELAAAAELVKGKADGRPVAVIRGLGHLVTDLDAPGARALVRPSERDLFRLGTREAYDEGFAAGRSAP
ncbi:coenzyme F420-0:L-glutamate ligase [Homoserinibacter sp. GY 40078]|uniref:coenzyme F420-0:L-glutamate ligase n=1 Tax=Homoserinibacter sp. GY 40078 TaxID=2603275 RepID=UPI0011CAB7F5|nr:coenzyme F420-0:L-glutamate ligase [Homoserinibacter sp. GY 40078]TXK16984.1 coenzyme F420-0:L-glutamate ligase [Homoserinibacter sp. GY 40078]